MACDSQASNNGTVAVMAESKIVRVGGVLFGSDGTLAISEYLRRRCRAEAFDGFDDLAVLAGAFADGLRRHLREVDGLVKNSRDGLEFPGMTLIARRSEFLVLDAGGSALRLSSPFWAIGSGGSEARGAMHHASTLEHAEASQIALAGIRAAIALDDGCCEPFRWEWTLP
jgi:ATP-dependent protease HslVU (ClpYQ) peptidase subunit